MKDTAENSEFKFFYVSKFAWGNPLDNERNQGHPKEKKVYRGWYNKDTGTYRLAYDLQNAIWLDKLKIDEPESGYTSDITELSLNNILNFPIEEDCLENLIKWLEIDNKDLKQVAFPKIMQEAQLIALIKNKMEPQEQMIEGFINSAEELHAIDPMSFEKVWEVMDYLLEEMHNVPEGSIDADWLSKGPRGAGINISNAIQCLSRYIGDNRRTNEDPKDLLKAIVHILNELIRAEINGK